MFGGGDPFKKASEIYWTTTKAVKKNWNQHFKFYINYKNTLHILVIKYAPAGLFRQSTAVSKILLELAYIYTLQYITLCLTTINIAESFASTVLLLHYAAPSETDLYSCVLSVEWLRQIFRIGTVHYAEGLWRMRRYGPVIAHCTDSEDFPWLPAFTHVGTFLHSV